MLGVCDKLSNSIQKKTLEQSDVPISVPVLPSQLFCPFGFYSQEPGQMCSDAVVGAASVDFCQVSPGCWSCWCDGGDVGMREEGHPETWLGWIDVRNLDGQL